jgi:hypothetical protein
MVKLRGSNGAKHSHWPENAVALASFAEQRGRSDGKRWRLRHQVSQTNRFARDHSGDLKQDSHRWPKKGLRLRHQELIRPRLPVPVPISPKSPLLFNLLTSGYSNASRTGFVR